jgi:hypothetical protein
MTINGKAKVIALLYKGTLTRMLTWGKKDLKITEEKKEEVKKSQKKKKRMKRKNRGWKSLQLYKFYSIHQKTI